MKLGGGGGGGADGSRDKLRDMISYQLLNAEIENLK